MYDNLLPVSLIYNNKNIAMSADCWNCYKSELFKTNMAIESEKLFYQNALH